MQTDAEVAAIAAGLTLAQRECLLAIRPGEERRAIDFSGAVARNLMAARKSRPALLTVTITGYGTTAWYRHTADGRRVAQHLKQENSHG